MRDVWKAGGDREKPIKVDLSLASGFVDSDNSVAIETDDLIRNILRDSKTHAVLLFGPAGTGKTHAANKLRHAYEDAGGHVEQVQFHPAYAYEDFMEGLRPERGNDGRINYEVKDGVFKKFCTKARENPDESHLFIIDEINRGNVPKVMGELMYCLEYRGEKHAVKLPYSKLKNDEKLEDDEAEMFFIPSNVHILGTMNSSDRSVAMLDVALRRRFHFVELPPQPDLLERVTLEDADLDLRSLLTTLNDRILKDKGRHHLLGHSYFLPTDFDETDGGNLTLDELKRRWFHQILPLLEEYFADDVKALRDVIGDAWDEPGTEKGDYFVPIGPDMGDSKFVDALQQLTKNEKPTSSSATEQPEEE